MTLPPRELIVLRSAVTIVLSLLIGQAGWAAAFLGGDRVYIGMHRFFALVTVVAAVITLVVFVLLRQAAGRFLIGLAAVVTAMVIGQYLIGLLGVTAPHIFLGVLTAMAATALTSWTYRHRLPNRAGSHG